MQTSNLSMEDETLPLVLNSKLTIEREGKIHDQFGQDKDTTDLTLAYFKSISVYVCPDHTSFKEAHIVRDPLGILEFIMKLFILAIMCLISGSH